MNNFCYGVRFFGLRVNIKKTKVLAQPAANTILPDYDITNFDARLEQAEHIPYLDSVLSSKCTSVKNLKHRIGAAYGAFIKLNVSSTTMI